MSARIDARIIELLEKRICHPFHRATGYTHYVFIKVGYVISGMAMIAVIHSSFTPKDLFPLLLRILLDLCGLAFLFNSLRVNHFEKEALERVVKGVANPKKPEYKVRIQSLMMTMGMSTIFATVHSMIKEQDRQTSNVLSFEFVATMIVLGLIGIVVVQYLEACDPLPPQSGKIGEWLRSFFSKTA